MKLEYFQYTKEDAETDGISYSVSRFSQKMCDGEEVIGRIIFEDKPIRIPIDPKETNENKVEYYQSLNRANSLYLRKITFSEELRYTGKLEDFFDFVTTEILPKNHLIWCVPIVCDTQGLLGQIRGFVEPLFPLPNKAIRLYSVNL